MLLMGTESLWIREKRGTGFDRIEDISRVGCVFCGVQPPTHTDRWKYSRWFFTIAKHLLSKTPPSIQAKRVFVDATGGHPKRKPNCLYMVNTAIMRSKTAQMS